MKKVITLFLFAFLLSACALSALGAGNTQPEKLKIVTTIFPEYDWVREILGDAIEDTQLTLLLDDGVDLHSYQPTVDDMVAISNADVFIYVGGHSDLWVSDALKNGSNPDRREINLFNVLHESLKPLEMVEGMEHHHDHDDEAHDHEEDGHDGHEHDHEEDGHDGHEHDHEEDGHTEHEHDHEEEEHDDHAHGHNEGSHEHGEHDEHDHRHDEHDEHVWLSLRRSAEAVDAIAGQLCLADPEHAAVYAENAKNYIAKLEELDQEYQQAAKHAQLDTLIFADRFPFYYMTDDYGFHYCAAFTGCSAESEASFETVALLADEMNRLEAPCILTIENRTHRIPETVLENMENGDRKILVLDSMQSVTAKQAEEGLTYLDVMKKNLEVLKEALQYAM